MRKTARCCSALRLAQAINILHFICSMKIFSITGFNPGNTCIFLNILLIKHARTMFFHECICICICERSRALASVFAQFLLTVAKIGLMCSCSQSMVLPAGFLVTKAFFYFHGLVYHP